MSTEKKPRKPRVVAPKTALELELEKGFEHAKELTTATKQVARIVGKFRSSEQQSILRQVWAFVPPPESPAAVEQPDEPAAEQPNASGN